MLLKYVDLSVLVEDYVIRAGFFACIGLEPTLAAHTYRVHLTAGVLNR